MSNYNYILDGKTPVVEPDLMKWARWFEKSRSERRVGKDMVGPFRVSTVFLGLDHGYGDGPPLLFETMVFKGDDDGELWMDRCSTWEDAEAMHERGCAWAKTQLD